MIHLTVLLTSAADLNYAGVYNTVFLIPSAAVAPLLAREKNANRIICRINDAGEIHSGLLPDGKGDYFITINKEVCQRFGLEEDHPIQLTLLPDDSDYGMPLPAEVAEIWDFDPQARTVFHRLTPGKQRTLLYSIDKLKGLDSRAKKAVQIHEYLKSVDGKLDFRELNAYIKADNRK